MLGEVVQSGDLALALDAGGVVGGEPVDKTPDPIADLEREVGGRGSGEGPDVVGGRPTTDHSIWSLALAHAASVGSPRSATEPPGGRRLRWRRTLPRRAPEDCRAAPESEPRSPRRRRGATRGCRRLGSDR